MIDAEMELQRPGRWIRAEHRTRLFWRYQIRRRSDGDFDVREIDRREPHVVHRGVPAGYVFAEFTLPEGISWSDLRVPCSPSKT